MHPCMPVLTCVLEAVLLLLAGDDVEMPVEVDAAAASQSRPGTPKKFTNHLGYLRSFTMFHSGACFSRRYLLYLIEYKNG